MLCSIDKTSSQIKGHSPDGSATKNQKLLMLCQDNYFVVSVKLNFCYRQNHYIDDQDKVQPVTDTDNGFTECQTPRKQLQSISISPVSLHAFTKTVKGNISEAGKVRVDCSKDSESDSYDKNVMKQKVNELVRFSQGNTRKIENSIVVRTNPNSYLGT